MSNDRPDMNMVDMAMIGMEIIIGTTFYLTDKVMMDTDVDTIRNALCIRIL